MNGLVTMATPSEQAPKTEIDALVDEALRLSEHRAQAWLTESRKEQVGRELNRVLFEIRYLQGDFDPDAA